MKVNMKVSQSCPTLCDPMDYTVRRILQARIPEGVAFPFSGDLPNPGIKPRSPVLASLVAQLVKNPPAMRGDLGSVPGLGRSPEKGKATHSSNLAWRIPWTV